MSMKTNSLPSPILITKQHRTSTHSFHCANFIVNYLIIPLIFHNTPRQLESTCFYPTQILWTIFLTRIPHNRNWSLSLPHRLSCLPYPNNTLKRQLFLQCNQANLLLHRFDSKSNLRRQTLIKFTRNRFIWLCIT